MGLFSRRRKQHYEAIAGARQGVVDYAGAAQKHAVGWTERAWEKYQSQIVEAAISGAASAVGVDGQEALEFMGLGDLVTDEAAVTQQHAYDSAQDFGLVDDSAQQWIDYYGASNVPFFDQLGQGTGEIGAAYTGGLIADAIFDDDGDPATSESLDTSTIGDKVETDIPPPPPGDGPPPDEDLYLSKAKSLAAMTAVAAGLVLVLR